MLFKYGDRVLIGVHSRIAGKLAYVITTSGDDILLAVDDFIGGHNNHQSPWSTGTNNWWVNSNYVEIQLVGEIGLDTNVKHWKIINKIKEIDSRREAMGYKY
jgi:hypothetical protein